MDNYTVTHESVETKPGCWNYLDVTILKNGEKIGAYQRNYSSFLNTFFPFQCNGQDLALYSPKYTCTRLLKLPECIDIGGEEPKSNGFCPVDYYVPDDENDILDSDEEWDENNVGFQSYGLVAGCIWGDDNSWKIQYLDLSRADEGILTRDERFGYIELPAELSLAKAVGWPYKNRLSIAHMTHFKIDGERYAY